MTLARTPLLCLLLLCLLCGLATQAAASPNESASNMYYLMGWEQTKKHSPAFTEALALFRKDQKQGYDAFLTVARGGDLDAVAMLCVATQVEGTGTYAVPAEFWEKWMVTLLGEGEGTYQIAMHHLLFLRGVRDTRQAVRSVYAHKALFRRSAQAGHTGGMFGVGEGISRGTSVRPLPSTPLPPEATPQDHEALKHCLGSYCGESQYWMVASSIAGDEWAPGYIGLLYIHSANPKPNPLMGEHYFTLGAMRGNGITAGLMLTCYAKGEFGKKDYYKAIVYGVLTARLIEGGKFVTDDEKNFPNGKALYNWGQSWMHGLRDQPKVLTQEQYDAAVVEGTALYEEVQARTAPARAAKEQLFAQARARLGELWTDFDKTYGGQ